MPWTRPPPFPSVRISLCPFEIGFESLIRTWLFWASAKVSTTKKCHFVQDPRLYWYHDRCHGGGPLPFYLFRFSFFFGGCRFFFPHRWGRVSVFDSIIGSTTDRKRVVFPLDPRDVKPPPRILVDVVVVVVGGGYHLLYRTRRKKDEKGPTRCGEWRVPATAKSVSRSAPFSFSFFFVPRRVLHGSMATKMAN